jgi:hypothetical protein
MHTRPGSGSIIDNKPRNINDTNPTVQTYTTGWNAVFGEEGKGSAVFWYIKYSH